MDAEYDTRKVKAEVVKAGGSFKFKPASSSADSGIGPRPTAAFPPQPPSSSGAKDESSLATGYTRRIIEQRGIKELKSGLGMMSMN